MTEEIPFEKALQKVEKIVEDLESGNISLEEALKKYEEGVRLAAVCQKRLSEAEKKVEILTRALDGTFKREAFELGEEKEAPAAKRSKARLEAAESEGAPF